MIPYGMMAMKKEGSKDGRVSFVSPGTECASHEVKPGDLVSP